MNTQDDINRPFFQSKKTQLTLISLSRSRCCFLRRLPLGPCAGGPSSAAFFNSSSAFSGISGRSSCVHFESGKGVEGLEKGDCCLAHTQTKIHIHTFASNVSSKSLIIERLASPGESLNIRPLTHIIIIPPSCSFPCFVYLP